MKRFTRLIVLATVVTTAVAGAANAKGHSPKALFTVVGTDPVGDFGGDAALASAGDALSSDLVEARIAIASKRSLNFVIKVNKLNPNAAHTTKYQWSFLVDDSAYSITKRCDPNAPITCGGSDDFAFIIQKCEQSQVGSVNSVSCSPVRDVDAVIDTAAGTLTVPVGLEDIGAKPGSIISGDTSLGAALYAVPVTGPANVNGTSSPCDELNIGQLFTVPDRI